MANIMVFFLFFIVIISLTVVIGIDYYFSFKQPYKEALANLKVGDKYTFTIEEDEFLFDKTEILECTIIQIQCGKGKHPYVKYKFTDGSVGRSRFDKFFKEFKKVN